MLTGSISLKSLLRVNFCTVALRVRLISIDCLDIFKFWLHMIHLSETTSLSNINDRNSLPSTNDSWASQRHIQSSTCGVLRKRIISTSLNSQSLCYVHSRLGCTTIWVPPPKVLCKSVSLQSLSRVEQSGIFTSHCHLANPKWYVQLSNLRDDCITAIIRLALCLNRCISKHHLVWNRSVFGIIVYCTSGRIWI